MPTTPDPDPVSFARGPVRFGEYRFDPESLELWRSGAPVPLAPKPSRILAALLARPGRLVSREELYAAGWDDTVVSVDLSLNTAIRQIRLALEDSAERPGFVQTVPRRGYRFVAEVEPATKRDVGSGARRARGRRPSWAVSLAALAITGLFAAVLAPGSDRPPTVSIAVPEILDDRVDPATAPLLEESIRTTAARQVDAVRVRAGGMPAGDEDAAYVVRSFLRTAEAGTTRLDVQLVRSADGAVVWAGWFNPHCTRVADPPSVIAEYLAGVLARHAG